jgi:actin-like ATPase involved in cell morphogenesis
MKTHFKIFLFNFKIKISSHISTKNTITIHLIFIQVYSLTVSRETSRLGRFICYSPYKMKIEQDVRDALEDTLSKIVEIFENNLDKTNSVEKTSNNDINQISCNKSLLLI